MKKQKLPRHNRKKPIIFLMSVVIALLVIGQLGYDVYVYNTAVSGWDDPDVLINDLTNAVNGELKPAPVDPQTGKIYIPETRLVLPVPPSDQGLQIKYSYLGGGNFPLLQVTSTGAVNGSIEKLWSVRGLGTSEGQSKGQQVNAIEKQYAVTLACSQGVQVYYSTQPYLPQLKLQASRQLANGKTLNLYTDQTCASDLAPVLSLMEQAQSY